MSLVNAIFLLVLCISFVTQEQTSSVLVVFSGINGGTWHKAEILPYKHAIAPYTGPPFINCLWGLAKNPPHHSAIAAMAPPLNNTDACIYRQLN